MQAQLETFDESYKLILNPHIYKVSLTEKLKDLKREKIDVFVSSDGITAENFMAKSGGERGRVMLAGVLGIQHLINLSTNGKGLNLLVLDEALSGIDAGGTLEIINTLNNLGTTVMMITQNIEDSSIFENCIRVVKEDGVSTLQS